MAGEKNPVDYLGTRKAVQRKDFLGLGSRTAAAFVLACAITGIFLSFYMIWDMRGEMWVEEWHPLINVGVILYYLVGGVLMLMIVSVIVTAFPTLGLVWAIKILRLPRGWAESIAGASVPWILYILPQVPAFLRTGQEIDFDTLVAPLHVQSMVGACAGLTYWLVVCRPGRKAKEAA